MLIHRLLLQNFRSYESADFIFPPGVTFIVGPNTAGKSNILEALYMLAYGKSFRAERDEQMVQFEKDIARVKGGVYHSQDSDMVQLEVAIAHTALTGKQGLVKKYLSNGLPKRRADFAGQLQALLFDPTDLDIVSGAPSLRREFLDEVLEQTDRDYRLSHLTYTKALRHRNALLQLAKETGSRNDKQFAYWDELLITHGSSLTAKREALLSWFNDQTKPLFSLFLVYDHSIISVERLLQYRAAEAGSGVTLVGPHRDDVLLFMGEEADSQTSPHPLPRGEGTGGVEVKLFGSRGQQRLAVVQLKLLQLQYMREHLSSEPVLLLDDIFSELDTKHINHILDRIGQQQTIITTTHKEFIPESLQHANVIELGEK